MFKNSLNKKMNDVVFYAISFFVLYIIIAYLFESNWLSEIIDLPKLNQIIKDGLTITATFLAPGAAFILFSDWKEQHNKQVRNEFGLKVFNQFEKFSNEIDKAGFIYIELYCLLPDEARNMTYPSRIPIGLDDPIFSNNEQLILSFFKQLEVIQVEFNILIEKFRYFGVVTNQITYMAPWLVNILEQFNEIHDDLNDTYSEYLQLLEFIQSKFDKYSDLRKEIERKINLNILKQLQEE